MIRSNEEEIILFLARLINLTNSLIRSLNTNDSSLINPSMANHIRRCEVIHDELELLLSNTLRDLLRDASSAHLWCLVVGWNALVGWDQILGRVSGLKRKDLLYASIKEEGDMSVLLRLGDMNLVYALGAESFGQDVTHVLWLEGDLERVVEFVLCHCCEGDILWVREVGFGGSVDISEKLSDLTDSVGAVVKEEDLIAICNN